MGGAPLMELEEAWIFGMWPRRLLLFEDRIEVRDFELLQERTRSRGYGWIDGVAVSRAGWFYDLLVTVRGSEPVLIRGLNKHAAERAGALIEERVMRANGNPSRPSPSPDPGAEHLLRALVDLRDAGV
ncbi:MAG: hypothetical protein M3P49_03185, partial [Actinomycetota bacterium]|nr:hypothetical protein [Actinomycetota bacterium]